MSADLMQQITDSIIGTDPLNPEELSDYLEGYLIKKLRTTKDQKQLEKKKAIKKDKRSTFFI